MPHNVSLLGFFQYIQMASKHGLSLLQLRENWIYLTVLATPLLIVWNAIKVKQTVAATFLAILAVEFFIGLVAAKPGSGPWHLAPFILINAYLIEKLYPEHIEIRQDFIKITYAVLTIVSIVTILIFARSELSSWTKFNAAQKELITLEIKYPNLKMGLTDDAGFQLSFLRAALKTTQIDYTGFMDLQFSGLTDKTLVEKLSTCTDKHFVLPIEGEPFSLNSYYTSQYMFSDALRKVFKQKYAIVESGRYFSVYSCG